MTPRFDRRTVSHACSRMAKPTIGWMPVRYLHAIVEGQMPLSKWLQRVPDFGLDTVELHHAFLSNASKP